MSETKHTAGPWVVEPGKQGGFCISDRANGWALCARPEWPNRAEMSVANARLIAAAPDLLEAAELQQEAELIWGNCPECQETQSWPELCEHCFESADKARVARMNAIAKARGETE